MRELIPMVRLDSRSAPASYHNNFTLFDQVMHAIAAMKTAATYSHPGLIAFKCG
jgi:hypothetical protein